jgi:hypothetical protein
VCRPLRHQVFHGRDGRRSLSALRVDEEGELPSPDLVAVDAAKACCQEELVGRFMELEQGIDLVLLRVRELEPRL